MFDLISKFALWFWESKLAMWLFIFGIAQIIVWEIVKRQPTKRKRKVKKYGR